MIKLLKQFLCRHKCSLDKLREKNKEPRIVEAECIKCGKVLTGSSGVSLKCSWIQKG